MCEYLSFIIRLNVARSQVTKVAHLLQEKVQTGDSFREEEEEAEGASLYNFSSAKSTLSLK